MFGWVEVRGSKTTQACAGSGQSLVSCLGIGSFREAQASSSEEKGEKKKRGTGADHKLWVKEDKVCPYYRMFGRHWECRQASLSHFEYL